MYLPAIIGQLKFKQGSERFPQHGPTRGAVAERLRVEALRPQGFDDECDLSLFSRQREIED
jgi:hypothetical protein